MERNAPTTQRLDHAVRTGLISAGLAGTDIGTKFGLALPARTGGIAGAIITASIPRPGGAGTALGASVRTVSSIVSLSSYQLQRGLGGRRSRTLRLRTIGRLPGTALPPGPAADA